MTPTLKVDSRLFWLAAQFRSSEPHMESINCVAVQPHPEKGVYIVALNGHMAGIAHDENGEASQPFVLRVDKQTLNIIKPRRAPKRDKHQMPATLRLVDFDGAPRLAVYDGWENPLHVQLGSEPLAPWQYPDWMAAAYYNRVGKEPSTVLPLLPYRGLGEFISAMTVYGADNYEFKEVCVYPSESLDSAVFLRFGCAPEFLGVIMPLMEVSDAPTTTERRAAPAWLKPHASTPDPLVAPSVEMSAEAKPSMDDTEVGHAA
ncbi:hypothetical protein N1030_01585 [Desulfovibrio mangrovi]|uniref:hypothetical protein n=1 Tax=Desulfovibrio mangrovi TaxID=2976983 RepID=UPI0022485462|nr:hypothetical protein [Desulfovibrio mangrovi]UZP67686.1 hypothetical protein N1030_01585 [Desulfovibrio mangrovi]